jgi:hypothetical protein
MKAKSPKSRCSKVDAIISKGVPRGGFDMDRATLDSCSRKGSKLPT